MSVHGILEKITERNSEVVGCIAEKDGQLYHNLDAFPMDCDKIAETMGDLLAVSDLLEDMDEPVNTVLTEYDGNCLVAQRIDGNMLIAVADHLHRGAYKKLQVGLSLQGRLLTKALEDEGSPAPAEAEAKADLPEDTLAVETKPEAPEKGKWSKLLNSVVGQAPEAPASADADDTKGKVKKYYRGQAYYE